MDGIASVIAARSVSTVAQHHVRCTIGRIPRQDLKIKIGRKILHAFPGKRHVPSVLMPQHDSEGEVGVCLS